MTIRPVARTLSLCALLAAGPLPAFAQGAEPSPAPTTAVPAGTPPEATLSPPPEAEKQPPPGPETRWVRLENPAFPRPRLAAPTPPAPSMIIDEDALAPYFAEGAALEAKAAFDRGHFARARSLLREVEQTLPVRYLAALAAVHSNEHAIAAEEMAALADAYRRVSDRALTHGGKAYYAIGRYREAAELLERVPTASLMYPEARVFLGRALEKAGDPQAAIRALEPLANRPAPSWGRDLGASALMQIADIARKAKDTQTERDALESIWAAHPASPEAELATSRLGRGPRTRTARVVQAETLIDAHKNKEGIALLDAFIDTLELPDPLACRAHFNHGKALRKERKHRDAIARLTPVVERCLDPDVRVRALYVLGSSSSIVDHSRAIGVYQQLAREFPEHSFADDALFFTADLLMRRDAHDEALEHLSELARLYPHGDFAGEALFKSFWVHRTRGDHTKALTVLDQIEGNYRDAAEPFDYERARYWRARTQQDLGQGEAALEIFKTLATSRPATYYGLMSRRQSLESEPGFAETLRAALVFPTEGESPWPLDAGTLSTDPHFLTAIEYLRLGFPEAVGSELLAANRTGASAEANRILVFLLDRVGDAQAAHGLARRALQRDLSGRITAKTRRVWEIAYPLAFRDKVIKHSEGARVPPDLLQGLMREESALDPNALSWAGAMGLTQLMPATARAVASQLKLRRPRPRDLFDPDLNLRLGATYLGGLIDRFDGELVYAVGSYNAGPGAISKWRRQRAELPLDAWAEEIPIAETRGYVKRVLRSFNTYQLLYGSPPLPTPPVTATTPEQQQRAPGES